VATPLAGGTQASFDISFGVAAAATASTSVDASK